MRCDGCGRQFPPDDASEVVRNVAVDSATALGQATTVVRHTLCPDCAGNRDEIRLTIVWTIGIIAAILILLACAGMAAA